MDAPSFKVFALVALLVCASSLPAKHHTDKAPSPHRGSSGLSTHTYDDEDVTHVNRRRSAAAPLDVDLLWPDGVVPYVFDSRVAQGGILTAMDHISHHTCIEFVPRTSEPVYVNFTLDSRYCNSLRGRNPYLSYLPTYKGQPVQLTSSCANSSGTLLNLLGSALGLYAEQVRPDRDQYVTVLWDNIIPSMQRDFFINPNIDTSYGSYDLGSIMHSALNANSRNGSDTMRLNVPYNGVVGQRDGLSSLDILKISQMYGCPVDTSMPSSPSSPFSTPSTVTFTSGSDSTLTTTSTPSSTVTQELTTTGPPPTPNTPGSENSSEENVIRSGSQIALRILAKDSETPLWLGCTGLACSASECPGSTFEPENTVFCQKYIYLIKQADVTKGSGGDALKTGDQVVLMQLGGSTVYCNQTTFSCVMLPDCRDRSGRFSGELCGNAVMVLKSPSGGVGQPIRHGDYVILDYLIQSVPREEWKDTLYCHPKDSGHCERRYCSDASLLDQQTSDGHYVNGCRLIYTIFKLPS